MESHHHGLASDLETLLTTAAGRRQSLRWLLAGAAVPLIGCGGSEDGSDTATPTTTPTTTPTAPTASTACTVIPEETAGPYPGDGTNSNASGVANALTLSGVVRKDIRASIAGATGVAAGVRVSFRLQLQNANAGCAALANCAVYLWHCDRDGLYSMYSSGVTGENYLRGVQQADANGYLAFTSIFPGCYAGRMPHVHFEVYPSLALSTSAANRIKTSQFTFPLATLNEVYTSAGYGSSARNLAAITYATDNVFSDGTALQMAGVSGNASDGYVVTLTLAVGA
jgi:protocatechuate 3,4-dioxygenase beta subunit